MRRWYEHSIVYSLDVQDYMDGNGDGVGDFEGLTACLGYFNNLGVDCLWLLPIFDSPSRDNGYDVRDYYRLHDEVGHFGEFARFLEAARNHNLRVLVDLPVNHTSDQHEWFRRAVAEPGSPYHDYYIWCREPPEDHEEKLILGEEQGGNWTWVPEVGKYYHHTFYEHQPDLNFSNPAVRREIKNIMRFWLRQGIDGFRIDAAGHMISERGGVTFDGPPEALLKELRDFVEAHDPSGVLLAEVDEDPPAYETFLARGEGLHMVLNFYLCNYLYLAFARQRGAPLAQALEKLREPTRGGQLANFLRNHDELDLERLAKDEFDDVMRAFAPREDMKIFGRGIRRRLAPMLGDDRRRLELAYSLLLSLPGTPVVLYGDEIAIGDDLSRKGRDSVRMLMQWSRETNGGFSTAPPDRLLRSPVREGPWGYERRNLTDLRRDPGSFFNWLTRAFGIWHDCPEFGAGEVEVVACDDERVFAHLCRLDGRYVLAVHNLSDSEVEVTLDLPQDDSRYLLDLFGGGEDARWTPGDDRVRLPPFGYRWLRRTRFRKRE